MEQQTVTNNNQKSRKEVLEWLETIVLCITAVVLVLTFCFRMVGIDGSSMENTLLDEQRVIISGAFYQPSQGDIVVISRDYMNEGQEPIIKRIIATEGQEVYLDCENDVVYVDGVALDEPYVFSERDPLVAERLAIENPHRVKEGHVFVLGDHRDVSKDSRAVGDIDARYILGRAVLRVYPFNQIKVLTNE